MSSAPPGWYIDPYDGTRSRWWDGNAWTSATQPRAEVSAGFLRSLPWRLWAPWLAAIGVICLVCFTIAEARTTRSSEAWFLLGFGLVAALTFVAATLTLRRRRWLAALTLGALVASVVSIAIFGAAAPSTSKSCNAQSDCDTGYGLGVPFLVMFFAVPSSGVTTAGWVVAHLPRHRREGSASAP